MKINIPQKYRALGNVVLFMVILLLAHFFWKFFILGDESNEHVSFFGWDISQPFIFLSRHIAISTHKILNFIGFDTTLHANNIIRHEGGTMGICVVWACSGIKQAYIFTIIILLFKGPWIHKLWYIPMGLVFVYLFNMFRIVLITAIVKNHPEQFDLWHEHILKYGFYAMIFLLWVVWNEYFVIKRELRADANNISE